LVPCHAQDMRSKSKHVGAEVYDNDTFDVHSPFFYSIVIA